MPAPTRWTRAAGSFDLAPTKPHAPPARSTNGRNPVRLSPATVVPTHRALSTAMPSGQEHDHEQRDGGPALGWRQVPALGLVEAAGRPVGAHTRTPAPTGPRPTSSSPSLVAGTTG